MPESWKSEELKATRDFLVSRGWTQKIWRNDEGVCLMEALYETYSRLATPDWKRNRVNTGLREALPPGTRMRGLIAWNDSAERTLDDVVKLLRRADHGM